MKKLKLNQSRFVGAEVLSRAELKKVMGGTGSAGLLCAMCYGAKEVFECETLTVSGWVSYTSCVREENCTSIDCTDPSEAPNP